MANILSGTEFAESNKRSGLHVRSKDLTRLNEAVATYQKHSDMFHLNEINRLFQAWIAENPKEYAHRGARALELYNEIRAVAAQNHWALTKVWSLPSTSLSLTSSSEEASTPASIIKAVKGELDECKGFACNDVGTFSGNINPGLSKSARDSIYERGTTEMNRVGMPLVAANADWKPKFLSQSHRNVYQFRAAECTNFGYAAAHVLTCKAEGDVWPRVEIVTWQHPTKKRFSHVYCVVGRTGDSLAKGDVLPPSGAWGDDARIVDCWLGSLGWECSYTVNSYPYGNPGFLASGEVHLVMDSWQGEEAVLRG